MKNSKTFMIGLFCSSFIIWSFVNAGEIHIKVKGVKNNNGHLVCGLFTTDKGFPSEPKGNAIAVQKVTAIKNEVECRFGELKNGTYAISILHDENDNDKMDYNFFGIPKEGYGASLNFYHSMSAPKFSENKFDLAENDKKELVVDLQY